MKPVSKTAYYCCGVCMQDALSAHPIIHDQYAKELMGDEGLAYWELFKHHTNPNATNTARCYIIDTWLRELLEKDPVTNVVLVGAGLDSRAFRMNAGVYFEFDEPGVIEYKNTKLPVASAPNPLQRFSINFENEKLRDKLSSVPSHSTPVFIIEGVLMYLTNNQRSELFKTLTEMFPSHVLLCDLMNARFFDRIAKKGLHEDLVKTGASFQDMLDNPSSFITNFGYRQEKMQPNVITASDLGLITVPKFVVKFLMKKTFMGYGCYQFRIG